MLLKSVFINNIVQKHLLLWNCTRSLSLFRNLNFSKQIYSSDNLLYFNNIECHHTNRKLYTNYNLKQNLKLETENTHVYKIMQTLPDYKNNLAPLVLKENLDTISQDQTFESLLHKNFRKEPATVIVNTLKAVSFYGKNNNITLADKLFDKLIDGLMDKCEDLTDQELADILIYVNYYLKPPELTSHNFHDLWSALDDICCARIKNWSVQKTLLFADYWYLLGLSRYSDFTIEAIKKLSKKIYHLTPSELVQSLFYINVCRKTWSMFDFEMRLQEIMHHLTLDELAIVSMAYFKTKTPFKGTIVTCHMLERLLKNTSTIHEITLTTMLKVIRYSPHLVLEDQIKELLDLLTPEISRLSMLCCVHISLLSTNLQLYHQDTLTAISEKFLRNVANVRLKDLERLTFVLTLYNFVPPRATNIYQEILAEISKQHRQSEIEKYPRCLGPALHYLGLQKLYSHELINKVLHPKFLSSTYGRSIGREILFLDASVEIECPNYNGNRLDTKIRRDLAKKFAHWIPDRNKKYRLTAADKLMLEIIDTLEIIHGKNKYLRISYLLPHFPKPDIVICKDTCGNPVEVEQYFEKYKRGDVMKSIQNEDLNWYAVVVGGLNMFIRGTQIPVGTLNTKLRQLIKIGYTPILVPWQIFVSLSARQKEQYIFNKIR